MAYMLIGFWGYQMLIWIIGGTSEAVKFVKMLRTLAEANSFVDTDVNTDINTDINTDVNTCANTGDNAGTNKKIEYIITVATYSGKEVLEDKEDKNVVISRMSKVQMIEFIRERNICKVVDLSHPYALEVTQNAEQAARVCNIEYIRYNREGILKDIKNSINDRETMYFNSFNELIRYLSIIDGNVFFTTGIKNIKDFEEIRNHNRFIYRVIPSTFSIRECIDSNVKMKDIVAMLGPFTEEMNTTLFKEFDARYVVMKDSGEEGGTNEKLSACHKLGITPLIVGRESNNDEGKRCVTKLEELLEMVL